jgi:hypothetical protein
MEILSFSFSELLHRKPVTGSDIPGVSDLASNKELFYLNETCGL